MEGPCYTEMRKMGIDVLDGVEEKDSYLPIIYEMHEGDDYQDPANWQKCSTNLDISVNPDFLRDMVEDAKKKGGKTEVEVKTLNFNLWVDSPEVFIPAEVWNKNTHGLQLSDLDGQTCYGGIEIVRCIEGADELEGIGSIEPCGS